MSGANDTESANVTVKIAANVCFTHLKPVTPIQQHPLPTHAQNVLMQILCLRRVGFFLVFYQVGTSIVV